MSSSRCSGLCCTFVTVLRFSCFVFLPPSNRWKRFIIYSCEVKAPESRNVYFQKRTREIEICYVIRKNFNGNFMLHCLEIIAVRRRHNSLGEEAFRSSDILNLCWTTHRHTFRLSAVAASESLCNVQITGALQWKLFVNNILTATIIALLQ